MPSFLQDRGNSPEAISFPKGQQRVGETPRVAECGSQAFFRAGSRCAMRRSYPLDDTLAHISYIIVGSLGVDDDPERQWTGVGSCGGVESFPHCFRGERPRDICARVALYRLFTIFNARPW